MLAAMAYQKWFPIGLVLMRVNVFAAEQSAQVGGTGGKQSLEWWKDRISHYLDTKGPALLGAIVVLAIGYYASRLVGKFLTRWLDQKPVEPPVRLLMVRIARLSAMALGILIALGTAGADVTALIAGVGVAGVGVGLAMQGVLGNLFGGLFIIFTKPFRVGEYIELLEVHGQVEMIELFSTKLSHPDRSRVVIPNRKVIGEIVHNYGTMRQLDLTVGVAYDTNLTETIAIVREMLNQHPRVLKEPAPVVGVTMLSDSSIDIAVKPWTSVADYGLVGAELYQAIVERFRERNISMPFPQREVRLLGG